MRKLITAGFVLAAAAMPGAFAQSAQLPRTPDGKPAEVIASPIVQEAYLGIAPGKTAA